MWTVWFLLPPGQRTRNFMAKKTNQNNNKKTHVFTLLVLKGQSPKVWAMRSFWKLCEETYCLPTPASGAAHIPGHVSSDSATMSPL